MVFVRMQPPYDANEKFAVVFLGLEWWMQSYSCGIVTAEALISLLAAFCHPMELLLSGPIVLGLGSAHAVHADFVRAAKEASEGGFLLVGLVENMRCQPSHLPCLPATCLPACSPHRCQQSMHRAGTKVQSAAMNEAGNEEG